MSEQGAAPTIPDWLASVPRRTFTIHEYGPGRDAARAAVVEREIEFVRLADVVAAAQRHETEDYGAFVRRVKRFDDDLRAMRTRAEAAEREERHYHARASQYIAAFQEADAGRKAAEEAHRAAQTYAQKLEGKLAALQVECD